VIAATTASHAWQWQASGRRGGKGCAGFAVVVAVGMGVEKAVGARWLG
jgi:hypothetical protein